jgi:hypothetical protein
MSIAWVGSPNFDKGRAGNKVTGIVIHWMAGTLAATDSVFQDKTRKTSAHYGIEDTTIHQYVSEADTAFHAGDYPTNQRTIGIEHSAQPGRDASEATYQTSARLIAEICARYGLPINAKTIVPHRSIVATQCPGTIDLGKLISLAQQGGNMPSSQDIVDDLAVRLGYNNSLLRQPSDAEIAAHSGKKTQEQFDRELLGSAEHQQIQAAYVLGVRARLENWEAQIADLKAQLANAGTELKPGKYIVK